MLFAAEPVGPVRNVTVSATAVTVSLSFNQPEVVTGRFSYRVEYYLTSDSSSSRINISSTTPSVNLSSLVPYTNYTIVVSAARLDVNLK